MQATVHHGDCLQVMREMAARGEVVQAIVCDPPAGISFMGRAWDGDRGGRDAWIAWMAEVAAAALALVPPGGHALVWALPRTSHWTATAWENAGWEVRDRVAHLFGTGFPKSLDVGKAIDRAAGAEREVIGRYESPEGTTGAASRADEYGFGLGDMAKRLVTAPATDAARQWAGWGTALKPACEDWWLLRRPLTGTVAETVQRHGTGAINVDACRVGTEGGTTRGANASNAGKPRNVLHGGNFGIEQLNAGRWPANVTWSKDEDEYELRDDVTPAQRAAVFQWLHENPEQRVLPLPETALPPAV